MAVMQIALKVIYMTDTTCNGEAKDTLSLNLRK